MEEICEEFGVKVNVNGTREMKIGTHRTVAIIKIGTEKVEQAFEK